MELKWNYSTKLQIIRHFVKEFSAFAGEIERESFLGRGIVQFYNMITSLSGTGITKRHGYSH